LQDSYVQLSIYDLKGNHIKTLLDSPQVRGYKTLTWNGKNENGELIPAGVYFYSVSSGNITDSRKIIYLK